jgi:hypothetical protein
MACVDTLVRVGRRADADGGRHAHVRAWHRRWSACWPPGCRQRVAHRGRVARHRRLRRGARRGLRRLAARRIGGRRCATWCAAVHAGVPLPIAWTHRAGLDTTHTFAVRTSAAGRVELEPSGSAPEALALARWTLTSRIPRPSRHRGVGGTVAPSTAAPRPFEAPLRALHAARGGFASVIGRATVDAAAATRDLVAVGRWRVQAEPCHARRSRVAGHRGRDGSTAGQPWLRCGIPSCDVPLTYAVQPAAVRAIISGVPTGATAAVRLEAVSGRVIPRPVSSATFAASTVRAESAAGHLPHGRADGARWRR